MNAILNLDDGSEAIFIRNDPILVESMHLPDCVTKRRPDIVSVELESAKKWLDIEESGTFERCREAASEAKTKGKRKRKKSKGKSQAKGTATGKAKAKEHEHEHEQDQGKKGKGKAEVQRKERRGWNPIGQFWEIKMRNKLNKLSTTFRSSYGTKDLTPTSGASEGESLSCICYKLSLRGE